MAKLQGNGVMVLDFKKLCGYHEKITPHLKYQNLSHSLFHPLTDRTKWENPLLTCLHWSLQHIQTFKQLNRGPAI